MILLPPNETIFPNPLLYNTNTEEPFCIGGRLSPSVVLQAYQLGIFPWYNSDELVQWWCPDPRFVLLPSQLHISKSMQRILKKDVFRVSVNQCFSQVITHCASVKRNGQAGTWIHEEMISVYENLHEAGHATSIEVWKDEDLVGGVYGIEVGNIFCGESMFSLVANASKVALIKLTQGFYKSFSLIDAQVYTPHVASLGATYIPKEDFLRHL